MGLLARLAAAARYGFGRIVPDPFAVAVALTLGVLAAAAFRVGDLRAVIDAWGDGGLWRLLPFAMQMCLMLVLGGALSSAPVVRRAIERSVALPRSPRGLCAVVAGTAVALAVVNWSLGLVGGAFLARAAGIRARREGIAVHYPTLCAAGYAGLAVWHGGWSGSAPLKAAQLADQQEVLGPALAAAVGPIPVARTLLGPLNLAVTGGLCLLAPLLFAALVPKRDPDARPCPRALVERDGDEPQGRDRPPATVLERFEDSALLSWLLVVLLAAAVGRRLAGGRVDFNTVNMALWAAALAAHRTPMRFLRACDEAVRSCAGVIVQFPLYAGIMGVMAASGLSAALSRVVAGAGPVAFLPAVFASAGLLNLFVPSGGGQWAVQGPIVMEAALRLGVDPAHAVLAVAYGDQWTNMLQPFWALPLLAITRVRARDMVGISAIWMGVSGLWVLGCLLLWSLG